VQLKRIKNLKDAKELSECSFTPRIHRS